MISKALKSCVPVSIKKIIKDFLFPVIILLKLRESILIRVRRYQSKKVLESVRNKKVVNVAFFALHSSVWKYDNVYRIMEEDSFFDPIIVVCPVINYGYDNMLLEMNKTYNMFSKKKYKVLKAYDEIKKSYIDINKTLSPDIIFYTNPHQLTLKQYYITHFKKSLSCYCQYSFHITHLNKMQYDQLFHNLLWKAYYETDLHKSMAINHSRNKGVNVIVSGFPGADTLIDKSHSLENHVWKKQKKRLFRVIWAPHHSIDDREGLSYSNFLVYYQVMYDIAIQFKDKIQIAFKPHPILLLKLYEHKGWGKDKADNYYRAWSLLGNGQVETGDYIDLFNSSDAMILDSASFMVEYLYCNKPSLFTVSSKTLEERFNEFGKLAFNIHYHGYSKKDLYDFIENNVCNCIDPNKKKRSDFIKQYLTPPGSRSASENIVLDLKSELACDNY